MAVGMGMLAKAGLAACCAWPADAAGALVGTMVVALPDIDRSAADPPPASLQWQILHPQSDRVTSSTWWTTHAVALIVHQSIGPARVEALVALRCVTRKLGVS